MADERLPQTAYKFKGYVVWKISTQTPVYVGITVTSIKRRWQRHVEEAKAGATYAISHAIRKYGRDAFRIEHTWSSLDHADLKATEKLMIVQMGTKKPIGYNITDGGDGTLGLRLIGPANHNFGKTTPEATREKIRAGNTGKKLSQEHVARIALFMTGRPVSPAAREKIGAKNRGRKHTPAARAVMSAAKKGKPGRPQSAQERAKRSLTMKRLRAGGLTVQHRANIRAAKVGKPGRRQSAEERQRRSVSTKGRKGRAWTEEEKAVQSVTQKSTWTPERRAAQSERLKGNHYRAGRKDLDEKQTSFPFPEAVQHPVGGAPRAP